MDRVFLRVDVRELMKSLELGDTKLQGEIVPGVYVFGAKRPMNRIRAYSSANLAPFAQRGLQAEILLLGHVHVGVGGAVARVEGFNGTEGERWAKQAEEKLRKAGAIPTGAVVQPIAPLKGCPHTGIR